MRRECEIPKSVQCPPYVSDVVEATEACVERMFSVCGELTAY